MGRVHGQLTYAFQAKARDKLNNMSALSAPIMIEVFAIDAAGNRSEPATIVTEI